MSLRASKKGLSLIHKKIEQSGWAPNSQKWQSKCEECNVNFKTWQRFHQGSRIKDENFQAFCNILSLDWKKVAKKPLHCDIKRAPNLESFRGRIEKLRDLKQYLHQEYSLLTIVGEGGIGKSSLAAKLCVELVEEEKKEKRGKPFLIEYIYWKDLRNRPDFDSVLTEIIEFTAGEQEVKIPDLLEDKIKELISIFKESPCLIIFDNAESIRS